jgi:hypothetical protein
MLGKLLIFGVGYVLGARAGRARLEELIDLGRKVAQRDDVKMVISLVQGVIEDQLDKASGEQRAA